jgi:hypothetical protein
MAGEDVTLSAEQHNVLQGAYNLMNKLYSHPDKAMDFKKLVKGAGFAVPELDTIEKVTKPYDEKIAAWEDKFSKLEEKLAKRETEDLNAKEEAQLSKELESARKEFALTDEGMKKVLDRMKEKKNLDVEAAAAWVVSKEPKAQPTKTSHNFSQSKFKGSSLIGGEKEEAEKTWNQLVKSPEDYFDNVVNDVLNNPEEQREMGGTK